ncbi:MAG TPA: FtsX-like permease family protein [Polyangiaceae bacterium]
MPALLRIALRNVLRHRRRSLITFSAMFLALAIMVGVRGFMNGMQSGIRDSIVKGQSGELQIHRRGYLRSTGKSSLEMDVPTDSAFLQRITSVEGVRAVTPRIQFGAMVSVRDTTSVAMLTAIDPEREPMVCPRRADLVSSGKLIAPGPTDSANLAPELAAALGLHLGDTATLLANDRDGVMNALEVHHVGTLGQAGMPLPDKKIGLMTLTQAQELLRMPGRATEFAISIDDIRQLDAIKGRLQAAVGNDYEVATWSELMPWVEDAMAAQDFMLNFLAGIFLFVALLGIVNTMLMSVYERTREIGTMMSVGVRRRQILGLFLLEAGLLGLSGGLVGAAVGGGYVYYLSHTGVVFRMGGASLPMYIHPFITPSYALFVLLLATGGALVAALWPSLRASGLRPVEALSAL